MKYQKVTNLIGATPKERPRFITKKCIEVRDQSSNDEDRYKPNKRIRFKTSMLNQIYVILVMRILFWMELLLLQIQIIMRMTKNYLLKIMHPLFLAFQKLIIHSLAMQKI